MPNQCIFKNCGNVFSKISKSQCEVVALDKVHFFNFPKDLKIRNEWVKCCVEKKNFDNYRVCSDHFCEEDYENLMKVKLMGGRLILKPNAVPKATKRIEKYKSTEQSKRRGKRNNKEIVQALLSQSQKSEPSEPKQNVLEFKICDNNCPNNCLIKKAKLMEEITKREKEISKIKKLNANYKKKKRELREKIAMRLQRIDTLKYYAK